MKKTSGVFVSRQTNAHLLNRIVNHPEVYPWVSLSTRGVIDLSEAIESDNFIAILGEHGGQVYERIFPGLFEAHSQVLPGARGSWMLSATQETLRWIFTNTEATEVITRCPEGNVAAVALAKAIGGRRAFNAPRGWIKDGKIIPADIYSLTVQEWISRAPYVTDTGAWFHDRLKQEFERLGASELAHPHDAIHDRYVGVACEMMAGGQPVKAVSIYNRFARVSGYAQARLISENPVVLDISSAIIEISDDDFVVLSVSK